MNVSRLKRKLVQGRRHLERSGVATLHCWAVEYAEDDTKSLHRIVAKLSRRKYRAEFRRVLTHVVKMNSGMDHEKLLMDQVLCSMHHWETLEKMARKAAGK